MRLLCRRGATNGTALAMLEFAVAASEVAHRALAGVEASDIMEA